EVVIDRRDSHQRQGSDHLDDVVVALRGLTRIDAHPGATSILWIISHPEVVTDVELTRGFDLVYAASTPWAAMATERSGREVRPLLQATDPARFHPGEPVPDLTSHALFVGRTRKIFRPIVRDAIEVGADLTIYGDGWGDFIDTSYVRAEHLSNRDLPDAYRSAQIVLNDHWSDMAELGFLSNRLFDAAASGALVVTDEVNGLGDVFGDLVRPYSDVEDLRSLLGPDSTAWISDEERIEQARAVGENHSFDARALTLLADVLDERGVEHQLRDEQAISPDDA
ncbi:MAG: glycosyltransferase, partial [Aeromicrobium sp.]